MEHPNTLSDNVIHNQFRKYSWQMENPKARKLNINSGLSARLEEFRLVALSIVTGYPLLLIGMAGVGKTQLVEEFAHSFIDSQKIFSYQVDDFTHPNEIVGKPDMEQFFDKTNPKLVIQCPIEDVDFIFLDEIHNANSGFRNATLSILAQREVKIGKKKIELPYKTFIAAINELPRSGHQKAFWDRFIFKHHVPRLSVSQLMEHLQTPGQTYDYEIDLPGAEDLEQPLNIPLYKVESIIATCYEASSDRSLIKLPLIIKAIKYIWGISMDDAIIKTVSLIANLNVAKELSVKLFSKEYAAIQNKIDILEGIYDYPTANKVVKELETLLHTYDENQSIDSKQIAYFKITINQILNRKKLAITLK